VRSSLIKIWRGWVKPFLVVLIVLCTFRSAVADWNDVPTGSMRPTILEGDRVLVNKLAYDLKVPFTTWHVATWADPERGDVVICYAPDTGERLVKRVIGLPGQTVAMRANRLYVDGQPVATSVVGSPVTRQGDSGPSTRHVFALESLGGNLHGVMLTPQVKAQRSFGPLKIPPDHYYVMGDNRDASRDSRFFGTVPRDQIVGRVPAVVLSLDRENWYRPRWDRFLQPIDRTNVPEP
jgi:signal peptidase I